MPLLHTTQVIEKERLMAQKQGWRNLQGSFGRHETILRGLMCPASHAPRVM